jgi:hypothetical protein
MTERARLLIKLVEAIGNTPLQREMPPEIISCLKNVLRWATDNLNKELGT